MDRINDTVCFSDGYIAVDHVELDIKEMLELGKKAAITRNSSSNVIEPEVTSMGSRYLWETYCVQTLICYYMDEKEVLLFVFLSFSQDFKSLPNINREL